MENVLGYDRVLARLRIKQEVNKPILGKSYLKYGQCWGIWGYFFQLSGILGTKHSANLDDFGYAFLGVSGPSGAVKKVFTGVVKHLETHSLTTSTTFADCVGAEFIGRVGYIGDANKFFLEHGMEKFTPDNAEELSWQYSEQGAALGAIYPHIIRRMFDQTHAAWPKENWERARAAGLNVPPEQDLMSYEETVKGENEAFMDYCRQCCPDLYPILSK